MYAEPPGGIRAETDIVDVTERADLGGFVLTGPALRGATAVMERGDELFVVTVALGFGKATDEDREQRERVIELVSERLR